MRLPPVSTDRGDLVGVDREQVAGWPRHQQVGRAGGVEGPAEPGHQRLEGVGGVGGQVLAPEAVDQPLGRHHPAGVQHQQHQQRPGLGAGDHDRALAVGDVSGPRIPNRVGRR